MYCYLIETRHTVGSYKTIALANNYPKALELFEKAKCENGFGKGFKEIHKDADKKNPEILKYSKIGGSHHNTIIRIRKVITND